MTFCSAWAVRRDWGAGDTSSPVLVLPLLLPRPNLLLLLAVSQGRGPRTITLCTVPVFWLLLLPFTILQAEWMLVASGGSHPASG